MVKLIDTVILNSSKNPQQPKANLQKSSLREVAAKLTEGVQHHNGGIDPPLQYKT